MSIEIERKFLPANDKWRSLVNQTLEIEQGYLSPVDKNQPTVRVRIQDNQAFLTIKLGSNPLSRQEYEYQIPLEDARKMMSQTNVKLKKRRHLVNIEDLVFEVDEFEGNLKGLILVEVELENAQQPLPFLSWLGQEVTHDPHYQNAVLAKQKSSKDQPKLLP